MKIIEIDYGNRSKPLLEIHQSNRANFDMLTRLELKYLMCIADRKREKFVEAIENGWVKCNICNNWVCEECYYAFQIKSDKCIGSTFGFTNHGFEKS